MKILTYVQAREEIKWELSEEQIKMVLTVSGRAKEWVGKLAKMIGENREQKNIEYREVEMVEQSGMGREILKMIPREEWVYLVNPSLAPGDRMVVREGVVREGRLYSVAVAEWILAQEIGLIYKLSEKPFTPEEGKIVQLLWNKQETIVDREEIATAMWGERWSEKYSDWGIDAVIHRVRAKIVGNWQLITVKGRGYMLAGKGQSTKAPNLALKRNERVAEIPGSIYPSDEYLKYMNDVKRPRKVYKDLFEALRPAKLAQGELTGKILCVNSYSYDNVDSVAVWAPKASIYFAHYDPRAIEMHQARIRELGVEQRVQSIYDDLRESKLKESSFDMVINDFRLNFNRDDQQNRAMMKNTWRILKPGGIALISTVVDERYESLRYGIDQEKAPVNGNKPGLFQADEHLVRRCWSVPYWRGLFEKTGFSEVGEFDIDEGKRWEPCYRRWWLKKE